MWCIHLDRGLLMSIDINGPFSVSQNRPLPIRAGRVLDNNNYCLPKNVIKVRENRYFCINI